MNDHEILALAAKAAEKRLNFGNNGLPFVEQSPGRWVEWNPLTNDGDALRLAVRLGITLQFAMGFAAAYAGSVNAKQFTERFCDDECAATRRAITLAAAEIGRRAK